MDFSGFLRWRASPSCLPFVHGVNKINELYQLYMECLHLGPIPRVYVLKNILLSFDHAPTKT